ncbi:olfactory receptor 5B21 [Cricetulus griseus]|uniref:Olfactory receptor 5V1 n=1 Tax=Cricetulus griseus TaxID=10029 RepID=G3IIX5_CRIGR|nr:olfactory receptor 5B21 [Cricetulus griseus]EGW13347.1 Olfactory receptor 5V1 [Cricetulus griseus]
MDVYNLTTVTQFILIGLSDLPVVRYPLFVAFIIIYQITLLGNGAILLAIVTERKLQTPMYYLLANLSLLDIFCPSATNSFMHTMATFSLSFCKSNRVNQYYCDIPPVVALSCSSTFIAELLILLMGSVFGVGAFLITLISYIYIVSTILKIQSVEGKRKAFSTCASHLLVVFLFYGTTIFTYIRPSSSQHSPARDRLISMLYGVITPMLNPIIYSLRNTEVKGALRKVFHHRICSQKT